MMSTDKSSRPEPVWNPTPLALTRRAAMLSAPLRSKVFERQSNEHYRACACSMQGFRQSMEDRHNIILSLSRHPDYAFFGIYDGHNGSEAAIHLATNLSERINNLQSIEDSNAIIDAVVEMDNEFINTPVGASGSTMVFALVQTTCLPSMPSSTSIDLPDRETSNKNNKEVPRQLSDASNSSDRTVLVDDETTEPAVSYKIRVFWAGDSRALVGRFASFQPQSETDQKLSDSDFVQTLLDEAKENARVRGVPEPSDENPPNGTNRTFCPVGYVSDVPGQYHFTCATKDHSPNEESERARIVATGGKVSMGRVNGHLAVSRAFGDSNFKTGPSRSVIAVCEVSEFTCEQGDFLFLFCDGLVEKFENDDLIQTLRNELRACERGMFHCGRKDSAYALANVFETVLDSGSTDNMSAIFVQFTDGGGYAEECGLSTYLPGPMYMKRQETPWVRNYLAHAARYGHTDLYLLRKAAYKEDIRRLEAPCTCHELMEEMADTSEEGVKARESKRSRNGKYMRNIEAELNLLREQKKQELAGVPKPIKRGSGSTELYSTDDLEPSETTPPLLMDDDDEDGDVTMQDARSSDLARRVTDLGEISLSRSDSMIISEDWGNDNARDSFHQTSSEILRALPLDSVACLSSPEADDIQVSLGQKRQRSNESVGSPVKSRSASGESGPHSKKRRIEVSHSTWLKHKDSGSGSEVVV